MISGSLPPISGYGDWTENIEIWDVDADEPVDLTILTEVKLMLVWAGFNELILTMSGGDIAIVAPGVLEWRAEIGRIRTLCPRMYDVVMQFTDGFNTFPLFIGTVSVLGSSGSPPWQ